MAHVRQSRPDSGLGLKAKVLKSFQVVPLRNQDSGFRVQHQGLEFRVWGLRFRV